MMREFLRKNGKLVFTWAMIIAGILMAAIVLLRGSSKSYYWYSLSLIVVGLVLMPLARGEKK